MTAPYKYPRKIEFVTDLPKTTSGKIRRVELRLKERQKSNTAHKFDQTRLHEAGAFLFSDTVR